MSIFADSLRPYWLEGLNGISGHFKKDIGGWICDEEFQVYSEIRQTEFTLSMGETEELLQAYAAEVNRIAIASFETMNTLQRSVGSKRSTAWPVIQTYYSAFFAAHTLMRMIGISCGLLGRSQNRSILRIAAAFGQTVPLALQGGQYSFSLNPLTKELTGRAVSDLGNGPHEAFWVVFSQRLQSLKDEVLKSGVGALIDQQKVSTTIADLHSNLSCGGSLRGSWLSSIRNAVNYEHKFETWYPYGEQSKFYDHLHAKRDEWLKDPEKIDLRSDQSNDLLKFQATCNFIIALCRVSAEEMSSRCATGKSFLTFGAIAFMNLAQIT